MIAERKRVLGELRVENPKRDPQDSSGRAAWYPYYASYSNKFAYTLLESAHLDEQACVLDPWNGGGTTTVAALSLGLSARGYDLNPVMVVIAKARALSTRIKNSLLPIAKDIATKTMKRESAASVRDDLLYDPLRLWFRLDSVSHVRQVERHVKNLLIDETNRQDLKEIHNVNTLSDLASFFYTVLFRSVRVFLRGFLSSNPTWIKRPKSESDKIEVELQEFVRVFRNEACYMVSTMDEHRLDNAGDKKRIMIAVGSSCSLSDTDNAANFVLSSPPYCTRIDYAVATLPELAVLGYSFDADFYQLRRRLIGTSTVPRLVPQPSSGWGRTCNDFLEAMHSHSSKASSTYYYKNHVQYFDAIYRSLAEIRRVLVQDGRCVLVIQDSYYKDLHNNLPQIIVEMGDSLGLSLSRRFDFKFDRSLARINPRSRRYRKNRETIESVLCFVNKK
jgi:SAM-dependent methyltransferase